MPAIIYDLLQMSAKLLLAMAIFVPLERLFASRRQKVFRGAFWTDVGYYFISGFGPKLLLIVPMSLVTKAVHHGLPSSYYAMMAGLPMWERLVGALVVGEVGYYWAHRFMHEIPLLWRFHAIHHSAEEMDWLVNTRTHPIDGFLGRFAGLAPIYLLGLAQPMGNNLDTVALWFALIGSLWGFFIHANLKWRFGWLEWVISTPGFHHWHHTRDSREVMDKNYASMLPGLDLVFGTYYAPRGKSPDSFGVIDPVPADLTGQLLQPFEGARPAATTTVR